MNSALFEMHQSIFLFLTRTAPSTEAFLSIFFINFMMAVITTFSATYLFPIEINKRRESFFGLMVSMGTFIPGFGCIMIFIVMIMLSRFGKNFVSFETHRKTRHEYTRKKPIPTLTHGAGWASVRLESKEYSNEERIKALYGIGKSSPKDTNILYAKLVSDDMEELRVSAFSLLEIQQDYIQNKINQFLKAKEKTNDRNANAYIDKQLALLYWELVYRNLSEKEFKKRMLDRSFFFAAEAREYLKDDTALSILFAKIYIEKGEISEAWKELTDALKKEVPPIKITPYLAEISYEKKDYGSVRHWLSFDPALRYFLKLNNVVNFWCGRKK